jgi:hypothetical protein
VPALSLLIDVVFFCYKRTNCSSYASSFPAAVRVSALQLNLVRLIYPAMATNSPIVSSDEKGRGKDPEKVAVDDQRSSLDQPSILSGEDILGKQDIDLALNAKMHLVNNVSVHRDYP